MHFSLLDWLVLLITLLGIISYGVYKGRASRNLEGYFLGDRKLRWGVVLLSVMGTQASAITFLTVPGQSFTDGMRFVQFYFGLPVAMVVLCVIFVPIFRRLNVYTAYEYLEQRFDKKTRVLTAIIFLVSRGLATAISILAPSLILHSLLGWNIYLTNIAMGGLMIIYTVGGGAKAVAYTQQLQFIIIYVAMFAIGYWVIKSLPAGVGIMDALRIAGKSEKLNVVTTGVHQHGFDWNDRYNIWSGIIGGFFLQLSYFGTDQSQVGRYLAAKTTGETRISLLMNGLVKIPLQFGILLLGVFIFVFYQFNQRPVYFNPSQEKLFVQGPYSAAFNTLKGNYLKLQQERRDWLLSAEHKLPGNEEVMKEKLDGYEQQLNAARDAISAVIKKSNSRADLNDKDANYVFFRFVGDHIPAGLVGLMVAIIFLAAWSSVAAALNSLASSTIVDLHKPFSGKSLSSAGEYRWSKGYTLLWGVFCILTTFFAVNVGNSLVEAVNILGSWFYGVLLGIFLVAFFFKNTSGTPVFYAAIITEILIIIISSQGKVSFLWFTVIGAIAVVVLSYLLQKIIPLQKKPEFRE
ncbi:MAG TPA: sodium:solute symporter [Puia sp.]|nr:sodium:solute symporter [Puia sp.]